MHAFKVSKFLYVNKHMKNKFCSKNFFSFLNIYGLIVQKSPLYIILNNVYFHILSSKHNSASEFTFPLATNEKIVQTLNSDWMSHIWSHCKITFNIFYKYTHFLYYFFCFNEDHLWMYLKIFFLVCECMTNHFWNRHLRENGHTPMNRSLRKCSSFLGKAHPGDSESWT